MIVKISVAYTEYHSIAQHCGNTEASAHGHIFCPFPNECFLEENIT